jgi:3-methyl-2-oxobutanoate hydroxymethyltransferase
VTTVLDLQRFKREGHRFAMLTAYDHPTARLLDAAGIPVLLVGDSLGMVVLGYDTTLAVTMEDMIRHAGAVARGAVNALLVGDLPFGSYQVSAEQAVINGIRLVKEGGMHAVKLEGGGPTAVGGIRLLVDAGIPVMAHLGLTPQSVHQMGGFRVQGKDPVTAERILDQARAVEAAGAFSLVLEAVPSELARTITLELGIPTIGIGAGPHTDGQVLVVHDVLGLSERVPRFAKRYADLAGAIGDAARAFAEDVAGGRVPEDGAAIRPAAITQEVRSSG